MWFPLRFPWLYDMGLSENSVYPKKKKKVLIGENDHQPVDIQGYPIFEANPHDAKALVHVHVSIFIQREDARPRDGKPAAHAQQNPMTTP